MPAPPGTHARDQCHPRGPHPHPSPNPNPNPKPNPTPNHNPDQAKSNAIFEAHRSSPMCKPAPHADVAVKHAFIKSKYQVTANPAP
jgi:hypothetical protein